MDLRHCAVDAPMRAECSPGADELLFCFSQFHGSKLCKIIEVSKSIENIEAISVAYNCGHGVFAASGGMSAALVFGHGAHGFYGLTRIFGILLFVT